MRFTKMNGIGNDFILFNAEEVTIENPAELARKLCRRGLSVGADGLMLVHKGTVGDARMELYNADGSVAPMCGNGIRCCAKFAYDNGITKSDPMVIETPAGLKTIKLIRNGDEVTGAVVDMGIPKTAPADVPVSGDDNRVTIPLSGVPVNFFCVNTGVPHAVTFDIYPQGSNLAACGDAVEHAPVFPLGTNVCFARVIDSTHIEARVWERGCGATLACGTGASAVLTAANRLGMAAKVAEVQLPGGRLMIELNYDGHIYMTGLAQVSYRGEI